jgi:protein TonB
MTETDFNGLDAQRTTRFLVGLNLVLALLFVVLEWNSAGSDWQFFDTQEDTLEAELELEPLHRDANEVPMMIPKQPTAPEPKSEELRLVEEDAELSPDEPQPTETAKAEEEAATEEEPAEAVDMYDAPVDFRVVEDLPQFPGGAVEFVKWLTRNLKYPPLARQQKVQGRVVAEFIVNKDGSVTDVQVGNSLNRYCDHEALRVLRSMPRWTAGIDNGKPCRTKVCIPIVFKL